MPPSVMGKNKCAEDQLLPDLVRMVCRQLQILFHLSSAVLRQVKDGMPKWQRESYPLSLCFASHSIGGSEQLCFASHFIGGSEQNVVCQSLYWLVSLQLSVEQVIGQTAVLLASHAGLPSLQPGCRIMPRTHLPRPLACCSPMLRSGRPEHAAVPLC